VGELLTRLGVDGVLIDIPDAPFVSVFPARGFCTSHLYKQSEHHRAAAIWREFIALVRQVFEICNQSIRLKETVFE
jgi:hypothetical protein